MKLSEGCCEMCGHCVVIRQKVHIVAEGKKTGANLLMLCPTCAIMFNTRLKPKLRTALERAGVENLPASWHESIYMQAAKASQRARRAKQ